MFLNKQGRQTPDAERHFEAAKALSDDEIARLEELQITLRDVLGSFDARLETLPHRQRVALRCVLYKEVTKLVFDFRLSIESAATRERIKSARTREERMAAISEFAAIMADIEMLHGE